MWEGFQGNEPRTACTWYKLASTTRSQAFNLFEFGSGGCFRRFAHGSWVSWYGSGALTHTWCHHPYTPNDIELDLEWHHACVTWDGSTMTAYYDGELTSGPYSYRHATLNTGKDFNYWGAYDCRFSFRGEQKDLVLIKGKACQAHEIQDIMSWTGNGAVVKGDPHLNLPHGGRADFRGEDRALYNFLSAKGLSLNVMTQFADFDLHEATDPKHKHVHGSFMTQAHVVARTSAGRIVRVSYWADVIGPSNRGFVNGTVDSEPVFKLGAHKEKLVDDVKISLDYSSLTVTNPEFEIVVKPINLLDDVKFGELPIGRMSGEQNVTGLHHRLDVQMRPRVPEEQLTVWPHGIIGQAWDGDGLAIDGETDRFPARGEFTTYAMAKGAIEGVASDYRMASPFATDFKFSRFYATKAAPRDVAKLVANGTLKAPKAVKLAASFAAGATEYNEQTVEQAEGGDAASSIMADLRDAP
jgi:hypothetical protein